jgi:hypothetical protein
MTQISSTFESAWLTPRTANYVAALVREGDDFDYGKWLQRVRAKEAQAKEVRRAITERILSEEMGVAVSTLRGREISPNGRLCRGRAPIPIGMTRSRPKTLNNASGDRIRRLEKVRDAWNAFQANRTRDAVYGYLEAVFAIVQHCKVRRRTKKLLRRAFKFADLPFDKNADPFAAIIRCTSDDNSDNKTISKWTRALRYVARCKVPTTRVKAFMKETGGVNACADRYAKNAGRGAK